MDLWLKSWQENNLQLYLDYLEYIWTATTDK